MSPLTKRRSVQVCLAICFFVVTLVPARAQESDIIKHVKHAVVVITTYDSDGKPLLQGTGFFIETKRLVTTMHVLKGAYKANVTTFNGMTYLVGGIVAVNEQRDLVLLETNGASSDSTTLVVEDSMPTEGEEVLLVSNPRGFTWLTSIGIIEGSWDFQGSGELIRITANISPGSSGGPVVNRYGRVVGVASMCIPGSDDLNFAVPGDIIKTLQRGPLRPLPGKFG